MSLHPFKYFVIRLAALTAASVSPEPRRKSQVRGQSWPRAGTAESLGREKWLQSRWVPSGSWALTRPFQHSPHPWARLPSLVLGQRLLKEPRGQILTVWVFWYSPSTLALTRLNICEWLQKQPTLFVQGHGAGSDLEASLCHVFGGRWEQGWLVLCLEESHMPGHKVPSCVAQADTSGGGQEDPSWVRDE